MRHEAARQGVAAQQAERKTERKKKFSSHLSQPGNLSSPRSEDRPMQRPALLLVHPCCRVSWSREVLSHNGGVSVSLHLVFYVIVSCRDNDNHALA